MRIVDNYPIEGEFVVYNMDDHKDIAALQRASRMPPTFREVKPRNWAKKPVGAFCPTAADKLSSLDMLVPEDKILDAIDEAHETKSFPYYHAARSWAPDDDDSDFVWDQDGLGYCWTWGFTAEYMTLRASLGMSCVWFPPVANGYLVNWSNSGNYLEDMIRGAQQNGLIPCQGGETSDPSWPNVDINSTNRSSSFWNRYDGLRADFRIDETWDINTRSGETRNAQECVSTLRVGIPIYPALTWWSHALGIECMFRDSSAPGGYTWGYRNSHRNKKLIILEGTKGSPDEAIPLVSVKSGEVG